MSERDAGDDLFRRLGVAMAQRDVAVALLKRVVKDWACDYHCCFELKQLGHHGGDCSFDAARAFLSGVAP